jgi:hypothetical protein
MKILSLSLISLVFLVLAGSLFASNQLPIFSEPPIIVEPASEFTNFPQLPYNRILPIAGLTPVIEWDATEVLKSRYELACSVAIVQPFLYPDRAEYYRGKADGLMLALVVLNDMRKSIDVYSVKLPDFVGPLPVNPTPTYLPIPIPEHNKQVLTLSMN